LNLQEIFTKKDIQDSIKSIKKGGKKLYKHDSQGKWRFLNKTDREKSAMKKFLDNLNFDEYYETLKDYELSPYTGVAIPKGNRPGFRPLLVPAPQDRIIFIAALVKIRKLLHDPLRTYRALGILPAEKTLFGKTKELKDAVTNISNLIQGDMQYVLCLDFKNFFSSIQREDMLQVLLSEIFNNEEAPLYLLIKDSVSNPIEMDKLFIEYFADLQLDKIGIPQGLAYSPLLASFYALKFDELVKKHSKKLNLISYRYLDDMIVLSDNQESLEKTYELLKELSLQSQLVLHPLGDKTQLVNVTEESFDFLGLEFTKNSRRVPPKAIKKFKSVFKEIFQPKNIQNEDHAKILEAFDLFIDGWQRYYQEYAGEHFLQHTKPAALQIIKDNMNASSATNRHKIKRSNFLKRNQKRLLNW